MMAFVTWILGATLGGAVAITNVSVEIGDGTALDRATVVFANGRITAVGKGAPPANAGMEVIDGSGMVVVPGFIETLSQIGLSEVGMEERTNDSAAGTSVAPAFRAADGFNPSSVRIPISREEGVTSAITSPIGTLLFGTAAWVDLTGDLGSIPDPNKPVAMFGGVFGGDAASEFPSRGGRWLRLREVLDDARFYLKNRAAFDGGLARRLSLPPLHLAALGPVLRREIPLVLYLNRASDILTGLRFARDNDLRLIVAGGLEAWRVAAELHSAGVPVLLKPTDQVPWSFDALASRDDAAALLHAAGVEVVVSAFEWDNNVRRVRQEAGIAVAYGLPRTEAIRALTERPARIFGRAESIGTVAVGKRANLVLWSGDPLELKSVAIRIWIDGVQQPLDNRQRRLAHRYLDALPHPAPTSAAQP